MSDRWGAAHAISRSPMTRCRAMTTMIRSARSVRWRRLCRCSGTAARACASPSPAATFAPATPCTTPAIGQRTFVLDGVELPVRANLGIYTQPISFIGLPAVAMPVPLQPLPVGVQIIAAPWREDLALRIAHALEQAGIVAAARPSLEGGK